MPARSSATKRRTISIRPSPTPSGSDELAEFETVIRACRDVITGQSFGTAGPLRLSGLVVDALLPSPRLQPSPVDLRLPAESRTRSSLLCGRSSSRGTASRSSRRGEGSSPASDPSADGPLVVGRAVRLDCHANVGEREVHVVPLNVELRQWGQSLAAHRLVERNLNRGHPDLPCRSLDAHRCAPGRGLPLHTTIHRGSPIRPCDFPYDHSSEIHRARPEGGTACLNP